MANINKVALLNNGKVVGAGRNKDNSNLAPIEATTTASRSYLVGDYLMLQGEFYKVISAIAIGDALTVGTNIQTTNVGYEVSDINELLVRKYISVVVSSANKVSANSFKDYDIDISNNPSKLYLISDVKITGGTKLALNSFSVDNTNLIHIRVLNTSSTDVTDATINVHYY